MSTWPFTLHCRNSRQVPATGTSTPMLSFPGVDERAGDASPRRGARAPARAGRADVRVEVVERAGAEEDRVSERAVPGRERAGLALRVGHGDREERRPGSLSARVPWRWKRNPSTAGVCSNFGSGLACVPATSILSKSWKFAARRGPVAVRIRVDDDAVLAGLRQTTESLQLPVRPDRRVPVDEPARSSPHEDEVDARVRPGAAPVVGQRLTVGLLDRERDRRRLAACTLPAGGSRRA